MIRYALPLVAFVVLTVNARADANDDRQARGAKAAALAIVAANNCESLHLVQDKLDHFLLLAGAPSDAEIKRDVTNLTAEFRALPQNGKIAECLQVFDDLGPYQANLLSRGP